MTMRDFASSDRAHRVQRSGRSIEYRLLYALGFTIFLSLAILRRLIPVDRLFRGTPRAKTSILREAREVTSATIPYAFMG